MTGSPALNGHYLELIVSSIQHPTEHIAPLSHWLCSSIDIRVTVMAVLYQEVHWIGLVFIWVVPRDQHSTNVNELKKHIHRRLDNQWSYRNIDLCQRNNVREDVGRGRGGEQKRDWDARIPESRLLPYLQTNSKQLEYYNTV